MLDFKKRMTNKFNYLDVNAQACLSISDKVKEQKKGA